MKAIFSNVMLLCYLYFLFTLFYVLNNNIQNIQSFLPKTFYLTREFFRKAGHACNIIKKGPYGKIEDETPSRYTNLKF